MENKTDWLNLAFLRDEINEQCFGASPKEPIALSAFAALAFVLIIFLAQLASPTLLIQFVLGAIALHLLSKLLKKIAPQPKLKFKQMQLLGSSDNSELRELDYSRWGLTIAYFELKASMRKDLPVQQNALLALTLIAFQNGLFYELQAYKWILLQCVLALSFFFVRKWEETHNESLAWQTAATALRQSIATIS